MYRVNDLARVYTRIRRGLKVHAANKMRFYGVESVEFQPVAPPPLLVTPVELRIPLAKPNPSPTYPLPSARRRLYFFPPWIFFSRERKLFCPVSAKEKKKELEIWRIFRVSFRPRSTILFFAVEEKRRVERSMVFRRPLISHEASPFTATGQVNRICDEAIDEASDELLLLEK